MGIKQFTPNKTTVVSPILRLVRGDRSTQKIQFLVPRYEGGVDLSPLVWSVKIKNADEQSDVAYIGVCPYDDETVTVEWTLGPVVTAAVGTTVFELEGANNADGTDRVWQSGMRSIIVYDDLDAEPTYDPDSLSEVQQLIVTVGIKVTEMANSVAHMEEVLPDLIEATENANAAAEFANEAGGIAKDISETAEANEAQRVTAEASRVSAENERIIKEETRTESEATRVSNEAERVSAEQLRELRETERNSVNEIREAAEELRVQNEISRIRAEVVRSADEAGRAQHEEERQTAENARISKENERIYNEHAREIAENGRVSAEEARAEAEAERIAHDNARTELLDTVSENEAKRVSAEDVRVQAEQARVSAETARAAAQVTYENAEASRVEAEANRIAAETARASAESTRTANEAARVSAENTRVQAETERATSFGEQMDDMQEAVEGASHLVVVQDAEPTNELTKIWVSNATDEIEIPTMEDIAGKQDVISDLAEIREGAAMAEQLKGDLSQLDKEVSDVKNLISSEQSLSGSLFMVSCRFEQNGLLNQNNSWRMFKFDVADAEKITVHTAMQSRGSITIPMVAFYRKTVDEITEANWNQLTTSDVAGVGKIYPTGEAEEITEEIAVPDGSKSCFVCIGVDFYNSGVNPTVLSAATVDLMAMSEKLDDNTKKTDTLGIEVDDFKQAITTKTDIRKDFVINARFNTDGTLNGNQSWRMFKFDVSGVNHVRVNTGKQAMASTTLPMIVFVNKEYSTVSDTTWNTIKTSDIVGIGEIYPHPSVSQEVLEEMDVPNGANTMLVSCGIDWYNNGRPNANYDKIADINGLIADYNGTDYQYAFDNVLCIGDSLTEGDYYGNDWADRPADGHALKQNYPNYLSRMLSCSVTNGGVSGYTSSQWYANQIGNFNLADYDSFIIWLGTNGGVSGTLQTDYINIIDAIKSANPDAFIVLMTIFAGGANNVAGTNVAIRSIASQNNLPVIDMSDLTVGNHPELHGNIDNPHFSKAGNIYIANRICNEIRKLFNRNPSLTEYGLSKGTRNHKYEQIAKF